MLEDGMKSKGRENCMYEEEEGTGCVRKAKGGSRMFERGVGGGAS